MTIQRLLVTGGCGFIGSNFVRFVLKNRPNVRIVNLDCLSYCGNPENLADLDPRQLGDRYRFVHGDIRDPQRVDALVAESDAVVHLAAESHVDRSILDARPFVESNVLGTQVLLDAVRKAGPGPRRFLYVSTDEVYGSLPLDQPELKFTEDSPLAPRSPYAASKAAGDLLAQSYHHTFGLEVLITRCSNNFGPYQFPEKIIPLFVTNLIEGQPVPLYGDGLNVRDWIHVEDHCQALLTVLERGPNGGIYNIGADNEQSNLRLTHTLLKLMNRGPEMIRHVADRPGHDRRYAIDAGKIARELGWRASRSAWPAALERTVRWYQENPAWWAHIKSGEHRHDFQRQRGQR